MSEAAAPVVTKRSAGRRVALWLGGVLLVLLLPLGGVLWWTGSEGSLARALQLAQRWLPEGQTLVATDVQGSIRRGGHIGHLEYSMPGMTVTVDDLRLEWSLKQVLGRNLLVRSLSMQRVHVRTTPQPDSPEPDVPFTMPAEFSLPIRLTLPVTVTRFEFESIDEAGASSTQALDNIAGLYSFDGEQHALRLDGLRYGESQLQGNVQLQAKTLALAAQLEASLRNLVPDTPFAMQVKFTAAGTLAGGDDALLDVALDATQQDVAATEAAQVKGQAAIHPWRAQPAQQVDLQLTRINAHAFHALAPVTALSGSATVQPVGPDAKSWDAVADFTNGKPGAWDQQQLPLRKLAAKARLALDQINIESARAELGGRAPGGVVALQGRVSLENSTQSTLQMDLRQVDLRALQTTLPRSSLTGPVTLKPWQQDGRQILADIRNAGAGPLDQDRMPMDRFNADLRMTPMQWHIETLAMQVGSGAMQLRGDYVPATQALDLRGELQKLPLRQIHRKMADDVTAVLTGKLAASGTLQQGIDFEADVAGNASARGTAKRGEWEIRAFETRGRWSPTRLTIERLHADALQVTADGSGIEVSLPQMDTVRAKLSAKAPGIELTADAAMLPGSGGGKVSVQLSSAEEVEAWLKGLPFVGEQVSPLGARGTAKVDAEWQGGWRQWMAGIRNPASQPRLQMKALAHSDGLQITLPGVADQPPTRIDVQKFDLDLQGNLATATLTIDGDVRANEVHAVLDADMKTTQARGTGGAPRWNIDVDKFIAAVTLKDQKEPWQLQLSDNLQLAVQTGSGLELRATTGSATLTAPASAGATEPLKLEWQPVVWQRSARGAMTLQSTGTITGLQPAWLDTLLAEKGEGPLTAAGMHTDLLLNGEWDVRMTDSVNIRAHLQRQSGDLVLVDSGTNAGIRTFDLVVQAADENVNAELNWDSERAGVIKASVGTRFSRQGGGWSLPADAPLSGSISAKLQDLSTWVFLAPPGWRVQGELDANVQLAGTLETPQLTGSLEGRGLNVRSVLDGLELHNGTLRATLRDSRMQIAELTFEGGNGSRAYIRGFSGNRTPAPTDRGRMTAQGFIDWSRMADAASPEAGIDMTLEAELQRMQVLVRNDRQMTLSGKLSSQLERGSLRVRGDLTVDRATITLPEASAPTPGDDVVIVRTADLRNASAAEARQAIGEIQTRKPTDMEIKLDLGRDLALEGQGITTRLEGELTVRSSSIGSDPFALFGEVRTVEGRYRAWGQELDIETGVVRFNGTYANPSINLLAIRPQIEVRAGVQVTGTLMAPRVQLYSEPNLPEGEKLSWVVLGRATVVTGAEGSSMQQAALGLAAGQLSGKLASGLGLDELGLSEGGVSIGKRISNELYLTYQQGLAGAASTLFIFYDITRRLTVRGQASEASAVDLVYTIKYE